MKRALITVFLFGIALLGANSLASAHPGHGGGPGHIHLHNTSHSHGKVIVYKNSFGYPYNYYYNQQPLIIHNGHLHNCSPYYNYGNYGGLNYQSGGIWFGLGY